MMARGPGRGRGATAGETERKIRVVKRVMLWTTLVNAFFFLVIVVLVLALFRGGA
ncbi:TPA: hypothetical protein HA281_06150 [Candidatus Woesearchaeota archaeon]|nr:MAG: hypothetical protein QT04_C0050G0006 [archaeon GW2011_AR11]HIH92353.1 hypothetical protein [Candidatus Woesearchaeota archaeon]